ncbi:cupin domain-containing protein [Tabrizicola sp.]|uniref:cupin domain-containing protein n=1 Tax=Tabrizicola sp. TaxID=2005166 RepID=UPI003F35229F
MTTTNIPLNFGGSLATIRLSHDGGADGIAVIEHRLPKGYAPPLHVHLNQDEVFHVLRGRICVEVGGKLQYAGPGDLLKAPKGIPHRFIVMSDEGALVLTITSGADFESFVRDASVPFADGVPHTILPPNEAEIARQSAAAIQNGLELLGPPLTLADLGLRAA